MLSTAGKAKESMRDTKRHDSNLSKRLDDAFRSGSMHKNSGVHLPDRNSNYKKSTLTGGAKKGGGKWEDESDDSLTF
jgi:hypothetical protein